MHVEEDGHPYALLFASCVFFKAMELFTRNRVFIGCSYGSHTAVLAEREKAGEC